MTLFKHVLYFQVYVREGGEPRSVQIKKRANFTHRLYVFLLFWKKECLQCSRNNENLSALQWQETVLTNRRKKDHTLGLWNHFIRDSTTPEFSVLLSDLDNRSDPKEGSGMGGGIFPFWRISTYVWKVHCVHCCCCGVKPRTTPSWIIFY